MLKPHVLNFKCSTQGCDNIHKFIVEPESYQSICHDIKHWRSFVLCESCMNKMRAKRAKEFTDFVNQTDEYILNIFKTPN